MSIVIVGGNECMVCEYMDICKKHGCRAKVFVKERSGFRKKLGCPDLLILFTGTVSHRMANGVMAEAKRNNIPIARVRSSSAHALKQTLAKSLGANAQARCAP